MAKDKVVNINVFYSCEIYNDTKAYYVNLTELFDNIKRRYEQNPFFKEVANYNNDPIRLRSIDVDNFGYYHIVFERLDSSTYYKTTIYGETVDLDLNDDEYIGHEVSILYDPFKNVMLIQRNISSLSPSGIEMFIRQLYFDYYEEDLYFKLVTAVDENATNSALNKEIYRQVVLKVNESSVQDLIGTVTHEPYEGVETVEIIITTKKSKSSQLNKDITQNILTRWVDDSSVEKLSVRAKNGEDMPIEDIDLIKQALKKSLVYRYEQARELAASRVYEDMRDIYRNGDDALSLNL
ncbi:DUF6731 family protein [Mammaliicoccus sciuri]|uniref:DUF6731 family protein n=1 Tax=Mammaliicoccus sciuri TaxID=1296 RepID=UPI0034DD294D